MPNDDPDRNFWEQKAPHYDRIVKGWFGRPLSRAWELTAGAVSAEDTVLEVAAGTGLFTEVIARRARRVVATDYAENMLTILRERMTTAGISNVESAHSDIYALGYPANSFDVVVAANVLHIVPDLDRAIDALCRPLGPGGRLIAPTFVHGETMLSRAASFLLVRVLKQPMRRRLTTVLLAQALERHGLRIARAETIAGLIPIAYVEGVLEA